MKWLPLLLLLAGCASQSPSLIKSPRRPTAVAPGLPVPPKTFAPVPAHILALSAPVPPAEPHFATAAMTLERVGSRWKATTAISNKIQGAKFESQDGAGHLTNYWQWQSFPGQEIISNRVVVFTPNVPHLFFRAVPK